MKKTISTLAILAAVQAYAHGGGHSHHHDHAQRIGAHVHGEAQLNIAFEHHDVIVMLESPGMNVFGFEHAPQTDAQFAYSDEMLHVLHGFDDLVAIKQGGCALESADIDWKYKALVHEHYHGDDHKHGHDDLHNHDHDGHSDVDGRFVFHCDKPDNITDIEVKLFSAFPKIEKISVQWVADGAQGSQELLPSQNTISVK